MKILLIIICRSCDCRSCNCQSCDCQSCDCRSSVSVKWLSVKCPRSIKNAFLSINSESWTLSETNFNNILIYFCRKIRRNRKEFLFRKEFPEKYSSDKICKYSEESESSNCYLENIGEIHPNCRPNCDNQYLDFNIDNKQKLETSS